MIFLPIFEFLVCQCLHLHLGGRLNRKVATQMRMQSCGEVKSDVKIDTNQWNAFMQGLYEDQTFFL